MTFLGLYREPACSPGPHLSNDAQILELTAQELERDGVSVQLATLEQGRSLYIHADLIFSMLQGPEGLAELARWKKQGALIVNDPDAARRTYRDSLCSMVREKELGFPHSFFVSTEPGGNIDGCRPIFTSGGAWLKRADVHAMQSGDVVRVNDYSDLPQVLAGFHERGLTTAVVQRHIEGDEIKFYGVSGGRFFWPHKPDESRDPVFDEKALHRLAEHAAQALDLSIYGGDAIIGSDGLCTLIDINDWPSFAPCRAPASKAIALFLEETFLAHQKQVART